MEEDAHNGHLRGVRVGTRSLGVAAHKDKVWSVAIIPPGCSVLQSCNPLALKGLVCIVRDNTPM